MTEKTCRIDAHYGPDIAYKVLSSRDLAQHYLYLNCANDTIVDKANNVFEGVNPDSTCTPPFNTPTNYTSQDS